ncbi:MAG: hypothetical protein IJ060_09525 [Oscillospiraceae bacterium]|nr:hypothetical protein [Oscillospiraceae bacterium]
MKKRIAAAGIFSAVIAAVILASVLNERKRIRDAFSEYEASCTGFADFLLKDAQPAGQENVIYAVSDHDGKYRLVRMGGGTNSEVLLSAADEADLRQTKQAFYKMTGRSGIAYISVSKDYIVFQEDSYGGKLIYSVQGGIDRAHRKTDQDYQVFRKINENWYAVYINAI